MRRGLMAMCAATALAAGGCGGDESATRGPAALAPAKGALLYVEATINPEGDRADEIKTALRKVARRDDLPALALEELDQALRAGPAKLDVERDILPWLGERAGLFLLNFEDEPDGALVLEAEDPEKARAVIERVRDGRTRQRAGVTITSIGDGVEAAVTDDHVVVGTPAGLDGAVDAAESGGLAANDAYRKSLQGLADERLGHAYADVDGILAMLERTLPAAERGQLEPFRKEFERSGLRAAALGFDVREDRLSLEFAGDADALAKLTRLGLSTTATDLVEDLPAKAWLAVGAKDYGKMLGAILAQPELSGLPGRQLEGLLAQVEQRTGVDLNADVAEQLEDAAFYAAGTGLTSLGVGMLVTSPDSERLLGALEQLVRRGIPDVNVEETEDGFVVRIPDAPVSVSAARRDDRVAVALGGPSAPAELLDPEDPIGDSDALDRAKDTLGDDFEVAGLLRMGPIVELADGFAKGEPDYAQIRPYLTPYDQLVYGERDADGAQVTRLVVTLR